MSDIIKGTIEDTDTKQGTTGGENWKRYVFRINGKSMSTFDSKLNYLQVGDYVEAEYKVNGKFTNLISIKKLEGAPPASEKATSGFIQENYNHPAKQEDAERQASILLSYAVNLWEPLNKESKERLADMTVRGIYENLINVYKDGVKLLLKSDDPEAKENIEVIKDAN